MISVRVHPALRRSLTAERAAEVDLLTREMERARVELCAPAPDGVVLEVAHPPTHTVLFRLRTDQHVVDEVLLGDDDLSGHLDAWALAVRHVLALDPQAPPHGWHALDYARRTLHDEGAAFLIDALAPMVKLDLRAARALFTLLFVVLRTDPLPTRHLAVV
jgi:hypothetical protein